MISLCVFMGNASSEDIADTSQTLYEFHKVIAALGLHHLSSNQISAKNEHAVKRRRGGDKSSDQCDRT